MTEAKRDLAGDLMMFTGTNEYHKLSLLNFGLVCTDGILYLARNASCFWLIDIISSYQPKCKADKSLRDIQFWTIKKGDGNAATVICDRDEGDTAFIQKLDYADFPFDELGNEFKIWVEAGECGGKPVMVCMLPSER